MPSMAQRLHPMGVDGTPQMGPILFDALKITTLPPSILHQPWTDHDLWVFSRPRVRGRRKLSLGISLSLNGELVSAPSQHLL
jgi:hypothetical protein